MDAFDLLIHGVKETGSYDPDDVLSVIEENLTGEEYGGFEGFLRWIVNTKQKFGQGNVREKYTEYEKIRIR